MAEKSVAAILKKLGKKYNITTADNTFMPERITTGIDTLDIITGGGYPTGRLVELYGYYSVGKTLATLKCISANQKLGKTCVFVDTENTFDKKWAEEQGVDIEALAVYSEIPYGELGLDFIKDVILGESADIIILDSIEGLVPKNELEKESEAVIMGKKAILMNKAARVLNSVIGASERKPTLICINQVRDTMNQYDPTTTPGGKGMKHAAAMRIELSKGKTVTDKNTKDKKYVEIRAKTIKNKTSREGKFGYWTMYIGQDEIFPSGYCDCSEYIISQAKYIGLVRSAGAWFYYEDEKYNGKKEFVTYLYDHQDVYNEFLDKIINGSDNIGRDEAKISESGESTSEQTERKSDD